jgi:MFS family permease
MPGVMPGHVAAYLWAAFVSIGIFTYATSLQPYLLQVNIGVPAEQRGQISGDLQFWAEVITLLTVGLFGAWSDRVGRRIVYVVGFLITGLAYAAYPFADDVNQLLIYRLIYAVGVAARIGGGGRKRWRWWAQALAVAARRATCPRGGGPGGWRTRWRWRCVAQHAHAVAARVVVAHVLAVAAGGVCVGVSLDVLTRGAGRGWWAAERRGARGGGRGHGPAPVRGAAARGAVRCGGSGGR